MGNSDSSSRGAAASSSTGRPMDASAAGRCYISIPYHSVYIIPYLSLYMIYI